MRMGGFAAAFAALALSGCSSFLGGELVREGEPVGQLVVVNRSSIPMNVVTISRCSAMSHGLNVLDGVIGPGQQRAWAVNADCWDVGVGNTGGCGGGSCSWHEAYQRVDVPANRSVSVTFRNG